MRPNHIWVSDITYIMIEDPDSPLGYRFVFLTIVMDAYSKRILGWYVVPTLETAYCIRALKMAIGTLPEGDAPYLIHHSDRGCQYCSHAYVEMLKSRKIQISMTQSGDPLENPVAERANGILKTEWLYRMTIPDGNTCKTEVQRIIGFYNDERPHMSVGYQTPSEAHCQSGLQKRCWKNPWERPPD